MSAPVNDGGSAFPIAPVLHEGNPDSHWSQFPQYGMSLRDYFAAKALPAHCAGLADADLTRAAWNAEAARLAYETADAMLKAREQTP